MSLSPGSRLGAYEIVSSLGRGGMGEVWRAIDTRVERPVALKVLPEEFLEGEDRKTRFVREAKLLASVSHPGIATLYSFEEICGRSVLCMELIEGPDLAQLLSSVSLPLADSLSYARQIAEALAAAHEKGIVHRDLKPANVKIDPAGRVKLLDFGIAKRSGRVDGAGTTASTESKNTEEGAVIGTVGYMSPEQVRGLPVDHRSDIFSFGALLYEMLTGQRAFRGETSADTMSAILRSDPPPPSASSRGIPDAIDQVVRHCLEKDRDERFQSAKDVCFALEQATADASGMSARISRSVSRARKGFRGGLLARRAPWLAAGFAVALAAAALVLTMRTRREAPIRAIAVLPLANLSGDRSQDYFADGITEELITELARCASLRVLSRTSTLRFRDSTASVPEIARLLGVDAVVEGSVQRDGDRVRVTAQLIRASPEAHVWAASYDGRTDESLALRSRVAGEIVRRVGLLLPPETAARHEPSAVAHEAFLLGRSLAKRYTREGFEQSIPYFERAIAADDRYALAFAELAESHAMVDFFDDQRGVHFERARELARRAAALEPTLGEAVLREADLKFFWDWDWSQCESGFRAARDLSPGSADTRKHYAWCLASIGRYDDGLKECERTLDVDPLSGFARRLRAELLARSGRWLEAAAELRKMTDLEPNGSIWSSYGHVLLRIGRGKEALEAFRAASRSWSDAGGEADALKAAFERGGGKALADEARSQERAEARKSATELEERSTRERVPHFRFAFAYGAAGDRDRAFEHLGKAFQERSPHLANLKSDARWAPLREDSRWGDFLRKLNLPPD